MSLARALRGRFLAASRAVAASRCRESLLRVARSTAPQGDRELCSWCDLYRQTGLCSRAHTRTSGPDYVYVLHVCESPRYAKRTLCKLWVGKTLEGSSRRLLRTYLSHFLIHTDPAWTDPAWTDPRSSDDFPTIFSSWNMINYRRTFEEILLIFFDQLFTPYAMLFFF